MTLKTAEPDMIPRLKLHWLSEQTSLEDLNDWDVVFLISFCQLVDTSKSSKALCFLCFMSYYVPLWGEGWPLQTEMVMSSTFW